MVLKVCELWMICTLSHKVTANEQGFAVVTVFINKKFNYLLMFKFIQKLMGRTSSGNAAKPNVIRLCINPEEMNEWQLTDVVLIQNCPFMTLTESKCPNVWYHEQLDWLFRYTSEGFVPDLKAFGGSKKILFERGFGRHGV